MDEAARARAEAAAARRAKILARQKDRITSITGAYTGPDEQQQEQGRSAAQPQATATSSDVPAPATSKGAAAEAVAPAATKSVQDQQQELGDEQQRQMAALMASCRRKKLLAGQQQGTSGGDGQLPLHLRSFDFLSLAPGLRELLAALAGYRQLANAVSEDVAAYLVKQEQLLKQQVTLLPTAGAAAAAAGKAASGFLQALLLTGDESRPQDAAQQQNSSMTPASASTKPQSPGAKQSALTDDDVAAAMAAAAGTLHAGLDPVDTTSLYIMQRGAAPTRLKYPLWWHGPMWSGSGYGGEAINYVLSLVRSGRLAPADVWAYHHGDIWREHVVAAMAPEDRLELEYLQSLPAKYKSRRAAVVVCHSMPTNWAYPEPMWVSGARCPPNPSEFGWVYTVGRTMFETDRLPALFVPRLNAMNEIWVPSEWQKESFAASGVAPDKLVVVPEGVNTTLFDPAAYTPLPLEGKAQLVFGTPWAEKQQSPTNSSSTDVGSDVKPSDGGARGRSRRTASSHGADTGNSSSRGADTGSSNSSSSDGQPSKPFVFISAFKWELRKGWDVLLQAYLSEFTAEDDVELYILTKPFGDSGSGFKEKMHGWADKLRRDEAGSQDASSKPSTADSSMALVQAAATGRFPPLVPASAVAAASPMLVLPGTRAGSKLGPARHLQELHGQQRQQQQRQQQPAQGLEQGLDALHCSNAQGSLDCSAAARVAAASSDAADAADSTSVYRVDDEHTKAYAQHITQQIRQFTWSNITAPALQQQRRRLLQDSAPAAAGAAAAAQLTAAGAQLGRARRQQRHAGQQDANPAVAAADAAARYPTLYVVDSHISDADFPRFYKAADAVVLPTRGEGWGRPQVEAMAMGLPVISTNWSGITAYLDESVGYPISVDRLVSVEGGPEVVWFKGLRWAQPSVQHLQQLMRRVYTDREEAASKGAAARARMVQRYSPDAIADVLVRELQRIEAAVP
ncbi:hypothetical protein COO60DRAFT_1700898 [Scenedesmus sp. NREL 46B-D3]|nr:hypothetical protein COO60DRAFT_1700898 [Scenedesmus sp. NREL 46B-D3]